MTKLLRPALVLLAILLLSGCGPTLQLEVVLRQVAIDVLYGAQHHAAPAAAAQQAAAPVYVPPPLIIPSPPSVTAEPTPTPSPTPTVCATLNPFAVVEDPATATISGPAVSGSYYMRQKGTYSLASTNGIFPEVLQRQVSSAPPGSDPILGTYTQFSVSDHSGGSTYATSYLLAPNHTITPGMYISGMLWDDAVRGKLTFQPSQPLLFMQTPVSVGSSWQSASTDTIDQVSVSLQGSVVKRDTVNACGVALDSFQVHIAGNIVAPTQQFTWTGDYDVATQFGGLIISEHVTFSGPDRTQAVGDSYASDDTLVIDAKPAKPGS